MKKTALALLPLIILLFLILARCSGRKAHKPSRGEEEITLEKVAQIPVEPQERKVSVASGSEVIYFSLERNNSGLIYAWKGMGEPEEMAKVPWYLPRLLFMENILWAITPKDAFEFSPEGKTLETFSFNDFYNELLPLKGGEEFLGDKLEFPRGKKPARVLYKIDPLRRIKKEIIRGKTGALMVKTPRGISSVLVPEFVPGLIWAYSPWTNHIIAGDSDSYAIRVLDLKGKVLKRISFKFQRADFPLEERRKFSPSLIFWKVQDRNRAAEEVARTLPDKLPVFLRIIPLPTGLFMVEVVEGVGKTYFDVLAEEGDYLYRLRMPDGYRLLKVLEDGNLLAKSREGYAIFSVKNPLGVFRR